jgi:hypothetical protein
MQQINSTQWTLLTYLLLSMKDMRVSMSRAPRCLPTGFPSLNIINVGNPGTSYLSASLECFVASTVAS